MRYAITFLLVLGFAFSLQAAQPTEKSVTEMITLMQLEDLLNQALKEMNQGMTKGMENGLKKSTEGKTLTAAQKTAVENFRTKFASTMQSDLNFAKVRANYIRAYQETFTQDEVNAIIAFYRSPAGKAILEKNPEAMKKANGMMQGYIEPVSTKLQGMLDDFVKELATAK